MSFAKFNKIMLKNGCPVNLIEQKILFLAGHFSEKKGRQVVK